MTNVLEMDMVRVRIREPFKFWVGKLDINSISKTTEATVVKFCTQVDYIMY